MKSYELDDTGVILLAKRIVSDTLKEYRYRLKLASEGSKAGETRAYSIEREFFKTGWFELLSGYDGDEVIKTLRRSAGIPVKRKAAKPKSEPKAGQQITSCTHAGGATDGGCRVLSEYVCKTRKCTFYKEIEDE